MIELDDSTGAHGQNPGAETGFGGASGDDSTARPHPDASTPTKAKGGAQPRNKNALTTGLYSARVMAARRRKKDWREMADEATAIIAQAGLGDDALGQRLGATLAELQFERRWLRDFCEKRGRLDKTGALKPAYSSMLGLLTKDCDEARRLIERMAELREASGASRPREIHVTWDETRASDAVDVDGRIICARCGAVRGHRDDHAYHDDHPTAPAPPCAASASPADPAASVACERASEAPTPSSDDDVTGHLDLTEYEAETIEDFLAGAPVAGVTFDEMVEDSPADRELRRRFGVGLRWCRLLNRPVGQKDEA